MGNDLPPAHQASTPAGEAEASLEELVAYLRVKRPELREQWASRITEAQLLRVMSQEEIFSEVTAVYDNYVDALETGSVEALQAYARDLSDRIIPRGVAPSRSKGQLALARVRLALAPHSS